MAVKPIPEGYHTVTPYLIVEGAAKLIDFLKRAFGAEVLVNMAAPDGKIGHAEVKIGNSMIMLGDAGGPWMPTSTVIYLYMDDVDSSYKSAVDAGAESLEEPKNQFYGDRNARVKDAFGNTWMIATHIEDVAPEEMKARVEAMVKEMKQTA